jgi:hypothetical protein
MTSNLPSKLPLSRRKNRKLSWFRARALTAYCGLALVLGSPALARADQDTEEIDARLGGYSQGVKLEKSGVVLTWMLFGLLAVIGVSVLFKNANRSHLD